MKGRRCSFFCGSFAVFLCAVLYLTGLCFAAAPLMGLPAPCALQAHVKVDGIQLTGVNTAYSIKIKSAATGTEYTPVDTLGDTFGEAIPGTFTYMIPTYDESDQPTGANNNEKACIELYHNSTKLNITYPAQGSCPAGSGEITVKAQGDILGFGGIPGMPDNASHTFATPITAVTAVPTVSVWCGGQEKNAGNPIAFGPVRLGENVTKTDCVVKNTGNADLVLSGLSLSGVTFSLVSPPQMPVTLVPDATQGITLKYAANAKGDQAGTLTITSNDTQKSSYNVPLSGQGDASIDLAAGWNLIGLPAVPSNSSVGSVLSGVMPNVAIVWGYTSQGWKFYNPAQPATSTLQTLTIGRGFWIKTTSAGTLTIN